MFFKFPLEGLQRWLSMVAPLWTLKCIKIVRKFDFKDRSWLWIRMVLLKAWCLGLFCVSRRAGVTECSWGFSLWTWYAYDGKICMGIFRFRLTEECCKVVLFRVFSMILAGSFFGLYSIVWIICFPLGRLYLDRTFHFSLWTGPLHS